MTTWETVALSAAVSFVVVGGPLVLGQLLLLAGDAVRDLLRKPVRAADWEAWGVAQSEAFVAGLQGGRLMPGRDRKVGGEP